MSEERSNNNDKKQQLTSRIRREKEGGIAKNVTELNRKNIKIRKEIVAALKNGAKTVPDIAKESSFPSHEILWHVMAMKKYGEIAEGNEQNSYMEYSIIERGEKTK